MPALRVTRGRSGAESVDDDEHDAKLDGAMATGERECDHGLTAGSAKDCCQPNGALAVQWWRRPPLTRCRMTNIAMAMTSPSSQSDFHAVPAVQSRLDLTATTSTPRP